MISSSPLASAVFVVCFLGGLLLALVLLAWLEHPVAPAWWRRRRARAARSRLPQPVVLQHPWCEDLVSEAKGDR